MSNELQSPTAIVSGESITNADVNTGPLVGAFLPLFVQLLKTQGPVLSQMLLNIALTWLQDQTNQARLTTMLAELPKKQE